eukprot:TRINITY_DN1934_c0_g1_i1.p1 TRINITY_DN1934_c0_g1~~TRINITY_DN1934_c0_g1_i1.p1  ORF type:complete len:560 (-),score=129.92 TRINITY_DN1934_c0_g1_i1:231-1910(-)
MELDKPNNVYRRRTLAVLKKWGVEGEMNEFNVRNAASSFAKIQVKNQILRWVTIGSMVFGMIFLGLMIASVVIGTEITKDFNVKQQVLVAPKEKSKPLFTAEALYESELRFDSSLCTVKKIRSMKFNKKDIKGNKVTIEFQVVSFYYSRGRNITLYGHTHMARVLPDNSVELYPITSQKGQKRYDHSKRDVSNSTSVTSEGPVTQTQGPVAIKSCEELKKLDPKGNYFLAAREGGYNCEFDAPLPDFGGSLDGRMIHLNVSIKSSGPAGLFSTLLKGASIKNLNLNGKVEGYTLCGFLASKIEDAVTLNIINLHGNLTCYRDDNKGKFVVAGAFAGLLTDLIDTNLTITFSVSQVYLNVITSYPNFTFQGGIYGASLANVSFYPNGNVYGTYFEQVGEGYNYTTIGFKISEQFSRFEPKKREYNCLSPCDPNCWCEELWEGFFPCNCQGIQNINNIAQNENSAYVTRLYNTCVGYFNSGLGWDNYCCSNLLPRYCQINYGCINSFKYTDPNSPCYQCLRLISKREEGAPVIKRNSRGEPVYLYTFETAPLIYMTDPSQN